MPETVEMYKYIHFDKFGKGFRCVNNKSGETLGIIVWFSSWRQWVFQPDPHTEYSGGCLKAIAEFLEKKAGVYSKQSVGEAHPTGKPFDVAQGL